MGKATTTAAAKKIPHGTPNGYVNYGCRSACCSRAWADYMKAWRAQQREARLYPHMPMVNGKRRVRKPVSV